MNTRVRSPFAGPDRPDRCVEPDQAASGPIVTILTMMTEFVRFVTGVAEPIARMPRSDTED
jgi:hypothetical protein